MKFSTGKVCKSKHGNETTLFPNIDTSINRKAINSIKRMHKWILLNALISAKLNNDNHILSLFGCFNSKKLSSADLWELNYYLFGEV